MIALLSRVSDEFSSLDVTLRAHYASIPGFELKTPEQIEGYAGGSGTLAKLWAFIKASEVVVHLVGDALGSTPESYQIHDFLHQEAELFFWLRSKCLPSHTWTYTQWEVYLALYRWSIEPNTKIFVCSRKPPLAEPLELPSVSEDSSAMSSHHGPVQFHLDTLKSLGCYPEIAFRDHSDLILKLEQSDLSFLVRGIYQSSLSSRENLAQRFHDASPALALRSWPQTIKGSDHWLKRPELEQLKERIGSSESTLTLLLGPPGSGKSALFARLNSQLAASYELIAIKADDLPTSVTKLEALGVEMGLPDGVDVVTSIVRLAQIRPVVVLIDQLDALAELVVESPLRLRVLIQLIDQLSGKPRIHVVTSCRSFERSHDPNLRRIQAEELNLELPEWSDVVGLLDEFLIVGSTWNRELRESLRNPQALNLFVSLHKSNPEVGALSNYQQMLDQLWGIHIDRGPAGIAEALQRVVDLFENEEQFRVPRVRLDVSSHRLNYLVAKGFLELSGPTVGFRHQTLYEHARVREFAREPQRFIDAVLSKQHILRARPQFWHGLSYLRAADPFGYDDVLGSLWQHHALRSHIRMMLLEFFGQQQVLRESEKACVGAALDDANWTQRCLRVIASNRAWFEWLAGGRLRALMQLETYQVSISSVLEAALKFDQDRVLELMRACWWPQPERDRLALIVLEKVLRWNQVALDALVELLQRYEPEDWLFRSISDKVRSQCPREAILVLRAWLDRKLILEVGRANHPVVSPQRRTAVVYTDGTPARSPERRAAHQMVHNSAIPIAEFAVAAPEQFGRQIWPWFLAVVQSSHAGEGSRVLIQYPLRTELEVELNDPQSRQGIVHGLDVALRTWAEQDAMASLAFLRSSFSVNDRTAQRLIARALAKTCAHAADDVLEYLSCDDRRLMLGDGDKFWNDSWALINAVAQNASTVQLDRLEQILTRWCPYRPGVAEREPELCEQRELWRRADRLNMLRAVPESLRSQELSRLVECESVSLPAESEPVSLLRSLSPIGSPISLADMQAMTDAELVGALRAFPDKTGGEHPASRHDYVAVQLSRVLGEIAKTDAGRAISVIDQLLRSVEHPLQYTLGAGTVLRAVSESGNSGQCLAFAQRLLQAGLGASRSFREDFANAMSKIQESGNALPAALVDLLESWLGLNLAFMPLFQNSAEDRAANRGSVLFSGSRSVVLPGGNYRILRALAGACLVNPTSITLDRWMGILETHVERVEDPEVWCALSCEMQFLGDCDHVRAANFVTRLLTRHQQVTEQVLGARIVAHALRWASEANALHWIDCFAAHGHPISQQAAAELLALRHYWQAGDRATELRLNLALKDPLCFATDADRVQLGLAHVITRCWRVPHYRERAHSQWLALAMRPGEMHLAPLMEVFDAHSDLRLEPDPIVREFLDTVFRHPILWRYAKVVGLVRQMAWLLERNGWEAELIGRLAIRIVDEMGDSYAMLDFDGAVTDILMLLQEHQSKEIQKLAVLLLEKLLEQGAGFAKNFVRDIDRRME